jgi:glycosyl transferase family 25
MTSRMENISHIVYINLDRRGDRKIEIEAELSRLSLSAERFAAIERKPGALGCGLSHVAVLQRAKQEGWANVLILEDDFSFLVDRETFEKELRDVYDNKILYDVIMLSHGSTHSTPFNSTLSKVVSAQTTSGYLVSSRFYDALIQVWSQATSSMESTGDEHRFAIDQAWKVLQPRAEWFCFNRRIGQQRPGFSDIVGSFVAYNC